MTETRRCVRCWTEKPLTPENFGRPAGTTGFAHHCRECGKRPYRPQRGRELVPGPNGRMVRT